MTCPECELRLAEGVQDAATNAALDAEVEAHVEGCAACRSLQGELRENALALSSFLEESLPAVKHPLPQRKAFPKTSPQTFPWMSAAAAAAAVVLVTYQARQWRPPVRKPSQVFSNPQEVTVAATLPRPAVTARPRRAAPTEPLKIKMLTSDPDIVIYWLVDSSSAELKNEGN